MSEVKVFIPTFKRNMSLKRAVQSLLDQTFTNWTCEVHNDDPNDKYPAEFIKSLNDNRFFFHQHQENLGPVATFNLMYTDTSCTYVSLLEDDNWWEPDFLLEMVAIMDKNPTVKMAWANMYLWKENEVGESLNLDKTIGNIDTDNYLKIVDRPHFKQSFSALHSNGAMLVRNKDLDKYILPLSIRFDYVEHFRERKFGYPILFNSKPLANYNITQSTSRESTIRGQYEHVILLITSFFLDNKHDKFIALKIWDEIRSSSVKSSNILLYAGIIFKNSRLLLKYASTYDWFFFFLYNLKHPTILYNCINAKKKYHQLWEYLINPSKSVDSKISN